MKQLLKTICPEFAITKDNDITVIGIINLNIQEEENITKHLKNKKFSIVYENEIIVLKAGTTQYKFETKGFEEGFGQPLFKNVNDYDICFMFCEQKNEFIMPKNENNYVINVKS